MPADPSFWVATGAVAMALINTAGSVLMLWIRAKYQWKNGIPAGPSDKVL